MATRGTRCNAQGRSIQDLRRTRAGWPAAIATGLPLLLTGCSALTTATPKPVSLAGSALHGSVHGGQQPVRGAAVHLYVAGTQGYAGINPDQLATPVTTDANGLFSITGDYSCTPGQQMYLIAAGGNAGGGVNGNLAMMAALGDCSALAPSTFITVNEVTTVGSVFALAPFMAASNALGTSTLNTLGLLHAFASVNKLVNIGSGSSLGSALPAGATGPTSEINTLADVLASCVNTTGGTAGDGSACGTLFQLTTPAGGTAPTDTVGAALSIARHPTLKTAEIYQMAQPTSAFQPQLASAPADWTMSIRYTAGGLNTPKSTTIDTAGTVWVANAGNHTVTTLTQQGIPTALTGNGLNAPNAVAIDAQGNAWVSNFGSSSLTAFTSEGAAVSGSPFDEGVALNQSSTVAVDGAGNIWVGGSNSITEVNSRGGLTQSKTTGPITAIAIDSK